MKRIPEWLLYAVLSMTVAFAAGCSGDVGSSSGAGASAAAAKLITGVAATGAPIAGGTIFIKDSSDVPVERHQQTRSDGSFTFDGSDLKPPFFLKADRATGTQNLYSVATGYGMTNITPITTIVVVQAAQRDDLDTLYSALKPAQITAVAQNMPEADLLVQNIFAPLMNAFSVKGSLVYGAFNANGTGLDAILDTVAISVVPGAVTVMQKSSNTLLLQVAASQLVNATIPAGSGMPTTPPVATTGSALYDSKCAGCHGAGANSNLKNRITVASTQNAIASNRGGMGMLSGLTAADIQAVYDYLSTGSTPAFTPTPVPAPVPTPTPVDGSAIYAANCAACHGSLTSSSKKGITVVRLQNAIGGNIGGMGSLSALTTADMQALVTALSPATPAPAPTPTPVPVPVPTPAPDGTTLYSANCAACHGSLASSSKKGISIARLQGAIANGTGGMGSLSTLSVSDVQAIVTVLTPATPTPTPTPTPSPVLDGPTLYNSNCASCHGSLASSAKAGATASRIQAAINSGAGGMGSLSALSSLQITAISSALATATPGTTTTQSAACGSCHAIPPATGKHSKHSREGVACSYCHGTGYSTTSFNAATHNNGVKNVVTSTGWNASRRTCANSCHEIEAW